MRIQEVVNQYQPITLEEMDAVGLLNRIDTKFMLNIGILPEILISVIPYYRILEIKNERIFPYISLYYDTLKNNMYLDHHNGRMNRYKIRFRKYVSSGLCKLEVKFKKKGTRTVKTQKTWDCIETCLSDNSKSFISENTPFNGNDLVPVIYTNFSRITLVNKDFTERVTIDTDLYFGENDQELRIGNLSLIEVKRGVGSGITHLMSALKANGIRPKGFSKYCMGRALMEPNLKQNRFKEKILIINKINNVKLTGVDA